MGEATYRTGIHINVGHGDEPRSFGYGVGCVLATAKDAAKDIPLLELRGMRWRTARHGRSQQGTPLLVRDIRPNQLCGTPEDALDDALGDCCAACAKSAGGAVGGGTNGTPGANAGTGG
jgi:hypothetical protein